MTLELKDEYPVFRISEQDEDGKYELMHERRCESGDTQGRTYTMVTQTLADDDFYQGLNMVTVIQNEAGEKFGYFWFDDISKHGEAYIESNGDQFGLEGYFPNDEDEEGDDWVSYYVFVPVQEYAIPAYKAL